MFDVTRKATLTLEDSDFFETMGDAFKETYSPRVPAELTYIVVIGDSSKLELVQALNQLKHDRKAEI